MQPLQLELPDDIGALLHQASVERKQAPEMLVKQLIVEYLEDLADYNAAALHEGGETLSLEAIERKYGLTD